MTDTLEQRQKLYDSIMRVVDKPTREVLYVQFIHKYYPEAFDAINGNYLELHKAKAVLESVKR
jgi:hypothetical protein